jgi:hypothetical protein
MNVIHCECGESIPIEGTVLDPISCPKCKKSIKTETFPVPNVPTTAATQAVYGGTTTNLLRPTKRLALETHLRLTQRVRMRDRVKIAYAILGLAFIAYFFMPKPGVATVVSMVWDTIRYHLRAGSIQGQLAVGFLGVVLLSGLWMLKLAIRSARKSSRGIPVVVLGLVMQALLGASWLVQLDEGARVIVVAREPFSITLFLLLSVCSSLMLGANFARVKFIDDLRAAKVAAVTGAITVLLVLGLTATLLLLGPANKPGEELSQQTEFWAIGTSVSLILCGVGTVVAAIISYLNRRSHLDAGDVAQRAFGLGLTCAVILPTWTIFASVGGVMAPTDPDATLGGALYTAFVAAMTMGMGSLMVGSGIADHLTAISFAKLKPVGLTPSKA